MRLRQTDVILVIAVQAGLAAALAWVIGHDVLGNPAPVFAPSAAVGTIVAAIGQRVRRTAQSLIGVGIGILIGDALLYTIGPGPVQIGLAVGIAIASALILSGGSGATVAQAGASAVVIATLSPVNPNLEWPRILDAFVGGAVGLVVVTLLFPVNPMRILNRAATPIVQLTSAELRTIATALNQRDAEQAIASLKRLRDSGPDLARLSQALDGAKEVVRLAPARWQRRHDVEQFAHFAQHGQRLIGDAQDLARTSATALQYDETVPSELTKTLRQLADATEHLRAELVSGRDPRRARAIALAAMRSARKAGDVATGQFSQTLVTQTRVAASDLLRASGLDPETANRLTRERYDENA
ncbi:FUSC family protein [Micromonospora phytophila]|uniref:FUSC family protein n=1 Tax=Micromonospora phytophila TaxID=709888 RepID=UPI00202EBA30|nr:FUSC family protein [Micromonospora phytophila]MCM0673612.1 FUSC family protein [Micromonospora phytophila]